MQIHGYTTEEVVWRGREIYEWEIRSEVEPGRDGEFVIVDVTTAIEVSTGGDLLAGMALLIGSIPTVGAVSGSLLSTGLREKQASR